MNLTQLSFEPHSLEVHGEQFIEGRFVEDGGDSIEAGTVWINHHGRPADFTLLAGGYKVSCFGKDWVRPGIEGCLRRKAIWIAPG